MTSDEVAERDGETVTDDGLTKRPIRSFVVRAGRMSPRQERGLTEGMARHGLAYVPELLDFDALFGRTAPTVLEIGFGMGITTADIAASHPDTNYLGVEVHPPGVGNLCNLLDERQLSNVRVLQHDAVEVLNHMIARSSLAGAHIYFPDPWHKARHHKRRRNDQRLSHALGRFDRTRVPGVCVLTGKLGGVGAFGCRPKGRGNEPARSGLLCLYDHDRPLREPQRAADREIQRCSVHMPHRRRVPRQR